MDLARLRWSKWEQRVAWGIIVALGAVLWFTIQIQVQRMEYELDGLRERLRHVEQELARQGK